jgi:NSS family neurotransmitter:Na+ symporter
MLPLGGLLIAIFAGWMMKQTSSSEELAIGNGVLYKIWSILIRFISPLAILLVFINLIGLIDL